MRTTLAALAFAAGIGLICCQSATAVSAGATTVDEASATGVSYHQTLDLKTAKLLHWKGKGYWCVNLLESSLEIYSTEDCQEDVEDAG